jgi:hypothetical protein
VRLDSAVWQGVLDTGLPLLAPGARYGLVLAWAGVRIAAATAAQKLPELCQIALRSKL